MIFLSFFKRNKQTMEVGKRYVIYDELDGNQEVEVGALSASKKMALLRYRNIPLPDEWVEVSQVEIIDAL